MRSELGVGLAIGMLVLFSALASCGSDPKPATESTVIQNTADDTDDDENGWDGDENGWDGRILEMERMVDKICACKDVKCIEVVLTEMTERGNNWRPTADQLSRVAVLSDRLGKCARAVSGN